jgi:Zn ribbon nucleic-acid-binding protein
MRIKHFSKGKFYLIDCPPGTRVIRCWESPATVDPGGHDVLMVPFEGREIRIPADPSELLPLLAEAGLCGLSLIGGPEPTMMLAGADCPNCGEDDLDWLSVEDGDETAHCDRCGSDFGLEDRSESPPRSRHSADRPR